MGTTCLYEQNGNIAYNQIIIENGKAVKVDVCMF